MQRGSGAPCAASIRKTHSTRMRTCIVHAGFPKTGTTSIQSSLFYALRDERFRLLTLDSRFGNQTFLAAFSDGFGSGNAYFSRGIGPRGLARLPQRSRDYLDRALRSAGRDGVTPVISAEAMSGTKDPAPERLRDFLSARGWDPRVVAYLRAPLDFVESLYQQDLRTAVPLARLAARRERLDRADYHRAIERLDRAFGREAVTLHWFDPESFPDRCVVRHFCESNGIRFLGDDVVRKNESINLPAVRFISALLFGAGGRPAPSAESARWRILLERLAELPGPPLRLHASLTRRYVETARKGWDSLEARLGRTLPMSLHERDPDEGIRCEEDLLDFSAESLEWLAHATGRRVVRKGEGDATVRGVVAQLALLSPLRSTGTTGRLAAAFARERFRRAWMRFRFAR